MVIGTAFASDQSTFVGTNQCPVGLVSGLSLDEEFGPGAQAATRCLEKRKKVKVVMQINQPCRSAAATSVKTCGAGRAYALGNLRNMLDDYEITHGMRPGVDFDVVAVVHGGGGELVLKDTRYTYDSASDAWMLTSGNNPFEGEVKALLDRGVKFQFCQNTTRSYLRSKTLPEASAVTGGATAQLIESDLRQRVTYTTAGVTAIADYQRLGYRYVQP
jgi:intracellular sulfur oxidation DsrE/DsrF family protein